MLTVLTVSINLSSGSFLQRLHCLPWLLGQPIKQREALSREYKEWCILGTCENNLHKFLYLLDHYILWPLYSLWAVCFGKARGFTWERSYECDATGIKVDLIKGNN